MSTQHSVWRRAVGGIAAVIVLALCGSRDVSSIGIQPAHAGGAQPSSDEIKELEAKLKEQKAKLKELQEQLQEAKAREFEKQNPSKEVRQAWIRAGAEFDPGDGDRDRLPSFSFSFYKDSVADFTRLPAPEVPFNVSFWKVPWLTPQNLQGLARFENLHELELEQVPELSDAHFKALAQAEGLRKVYLTDVATDAALAAMGTLPQLQLLRVWNPYAKPESVTATGFEGLSRSLSLRSLEFVEFPVDDEALKHLSRLTTLRSLVVNSSAHITDEGLEHLPALTHLEELGFLSRGNHFTDAGMRHIARLQGLTRLRLRHAVITEPGVLRLAALKNLRSLDLAATYITDQSLADLADLTELESLDLRGCRKLTPAGLQHLQRLKTLRFLELAREMRCEAELQAFREALPDCKINTASGYTAPL